MYVYVLLRERQREKLLSYTQGYQVIPLFVFWFGEATFPALVPEDDMTQLLYLGQQQLNATVGFFEGLQKRVFYSGLILCTVVGILIMCVVLDKTVS